MQNLDMEQLVHLAKSRNKEAFTDLIQMNMAQMYKVSLSILMNDDDVADAIQESILNCWEKISTLREEKYFRTWLIRILINNSYAILNDRKRYADLSEWEEPAFEDEYTFELKEALGKLDEKYRLVMTLYYVYDLKTSEIAELAGLSKSTVTTRLQRGREILAKYYGDFR